MVFKDSPKIGSSGETQDSASNFSGFQWFSRVFKSFREFPRIPRKFDVCAISNLLQELSRTSNDFQ